MATVAAAHRARAGDPGRRRPSLGEGTGVSWPGSLSPIGRWSQPGALQRLLLASNLPLPALRGHLQRRQSRRPARSEASVSGQKARATGGMKRRRRWNS
ncbi:hypothetical protein M8494_02865 [Serratia ureilytica]